VEDVSNKHFYSIDVYLIDGMSKEWEWENYNFTANEYTPHIDPDEWDRPRLQTQPQ
jgi:hypothetical protein